MSRTATGFVLLILAGALPVQAQKTDVVTLQNGLRMASHDNTHKGNFR